MTIKEFFASPLRVFLTIDLLLVVGMFIGGILAGLLWTPMAYVFVLVAPLLLLVLHLPFIPLEYAQDWSSLPKGLIESNKILRGMWVEGESYFRQ